MSELLSTCPWQEFEDFSKERLKSLQLPSEGGCYRAAPGGWERWHESDVYELRRMEFFTGRRSRQELGKIERQKEDFVGLERLTLKTYGPDSPAHGAASVVSWIYRVKLAKAAGAWFAYEPLVFYLGCLILKLEYHKKFEPNWEIGRRLKEGGQKGAEIVHGDPNTRLARRGNGSHA